MKTNLNRMCKNCQLLGGPECDGTEVQAWTGCIYQKPLDKSQKESSWIPIMPRQKMEERGVLISKLQEQK